MGTACSVCLSSRTGNAVQYRRLQDTHQTAGDLRHGILATIDLDQLGNRSLRYRGAYGWGDSNVVEQQARLNSVVATRRHASDD